jgi:hypothetical protein
MSTSAIPCVRFASYVLALTLGFLASPRPAVAQAAPTISGPLLQPGANCGFIAPCTRIGEIGLHIGALSSLRTDKNRSFLDVQGQARLSITLLDLAEIGATFSGHIGRDSTGSFFAVSSPATAYARLRLLPLPFFRPLSSSIFRLALHAQHDFVDANFGTQEPPGIARTTLHVVGGKTYGPIDIDGSVGFVLSPRHDRPAQQAAFQLGLAASYWFQRANKDHPTDQLRIQLEALYQFAQGPRFSTQGTLLAGLLGMSRNGFGGSFAVGPEYIDQYVGLRVMAGLQFSWGPHVRNPWAEKKAAEPKETPAWIWALLGAIDPILREDGCVWTDPTPRQASYQWFCIGTPDPQNAGMIRLNSGQRLPVGTHLLEHGTALRVNDGTKVADIPLSARFRKAVLDYVDGLLAHAKDPAICNGRIDPVPQGMDDGWAAAVAHDEQGGAAAILGMHIYRRITCDPEAQSSVELLSMFGKLGGRGPMRAKPRLDEDRFAPPKRGPGNGGGNGDIAEHKQPPSKLPGQHRFSIRENEERGGHVLGKHVGKSEEQLSKRLEAEPNLKTASSFRDESTAEQAIASAIDSNQSTIDKWLKKPRREKLVLEYESESNIGTSLKRGASTARPSNVATIVLQPDSDGGFYVLTAYLE